MVYYIFVKPKVVTVEEEKAANNLATGQVKPQGLTNFYEQLFATTTTKVDACSDEERLEAELDAAEQETFASSRHILPRGIIINQRGEMRSTIPGLSVPRTEVKPNGTFVRIRLPGSKKEEKRQLVNVLVSTFRPGWIKELGLTVDGRQDRSQTRCRVGYLDGNINNHSLRNLTIENLTLKDKRKTTKKHKMADSPRLEGDLNVLTNLSTPGVQTRASKRRRVSKTP